MIIIIFTVLAILIIVCTQTLWLHPRVRKDILTSNYSENSDLWIKKQGNENLLILLHGMYSSPEHFVELAEKTVETGWDVYLPVLPNSANNSKMLQLQEPFQWEESLQVAFQKSLIHNKDYQKIVLGGHSQGGALALTIAPSLTFLNGILIVAAPMHMTHNNNSLLRNIGISLSGLLIFLIPKKGMTIKNKNVKERSLVEKNIEKESFYYGLTLHSMALGLKKTRRHLSQITYPCFLAYEKGDKLVHFSDFDYIKNRISSSIIQELVFEIPKSLEPYSKRHALLSYIHTKDKLFQEAISFLKNLEKQ